MTSFIRTRLASLTPKPRPLTDELLPSLKDAVFAHQFHSASFPTITEKTIRLAEVAPTTHRATAVLHAAHKIGTIDPQTGHPNTSAITRNMVNDMPVLAGISKQREFVMLLFFMEEEIARWDSLEAEEKDIRDALDGVALEEALKVVQTKKKILPSFRDQSGNVLGGAAGEEQLPSYDE